MQEKPRKREAWKTITFAQSGFSSAVIIILIYQSNVCHSLAVLHSSHELL